MTDQHTINKTQSINCLTLLLAAALLTGCATSSTQRIEVDSIQFKGDTQTQITSADLAQSNYAKLAEGETVVIAISPDRSGAISIPNPVKVSVTEVISENDLNSLEHSQSRGLEHLRAKCDIDSDGIWDRYCPELLSTLSASESESVVMFETVSTVSPSTYGRDDWSAFTAFDRNDATGTTKPVYLRLLTVNRGNKPFSGDLDIRVNLPAQVDFVQVKDLYKVSSNANTKAVVGGLLTVAAIASGNPYAYLSTAEDVPFINDYKRMRSYEDFTTQTVGRKLSITANSISIEPNQGVELIYEISYEYQEQ